MLNFLLFLILFAEIAFITYFDRKIYSNYFSPAIILSWPLLIIITLALSLTTLLNFKPVSSELLILTIAGIACFWSGSFFWSVLIPENVLRKSAGRIKPDMDISVNFKRVAFIISWVVIAVMLYSFVAAFRNVSSLRAIGTDAFAHEYGGSGVPGHALGLAMPLLIFFISIVNKEDLLVIFTILLLVFISLLYQVKTWLFIPLIGGIILRYRNKKMPRLNAITIVLFVAIVMALFGLTYTFSMKEREGYSFLDKMEILLKHFTGYIFAGVLGFGEHVKAHYPFGADPKALFMPFVNLYNFITGENVSGVVSSYHVFIDKGDHVDVNVKTFFGTILINGGYLVGSLYTVCLSIALYFIWIIASLSKNYLFIVLYIFLAAALVLGWFDFYYNQLPFLELPVYMIFLILLTSIKKKATA